MQEEEAIHFFCPALPSHSPCSFQVLCVWFVCVPKMKYATGSEGGGGYAQPIFLRVYLFFFYRRRSPYFLLSPLLTESEPPVAHFSLLFLLPNSIKLYFYILKNLLCFHWGGFVVFPQKCYRCSGWEDIFI